MSTETPTEFGSGGPSAVSAVQNVTVNPPLPCGANPPVECQCALAPPLTCDRSHETRAS
jgi:hypothetical protein